MPRGVFIVQVNCTDAAREEEFNRWYTHTHLPDLSKTKGMIRARRFKHVRSDSGESSRYLTLYELDSDDLDESMKDFMRIVSEVFATGRHIDCFNVTGLYLFEEIDPDSLKPLEEVNYPKQVPGSEPTPEW